MPLEDLERNVRWHSTPDEQVAVSGTMGIAWVGIYQSEVYADWRPHIDDNVKGMEEIFDGEQHDDDGNEFQADEHDDEVGQNMGLDPLLITAAKRA